MNILDKKGVRFYADGTKEYIGVTSAIKLTQGGDSLDVLMKWASNTPNYTEVQKGAMRFGTFMHGIAEDILKGILCGYNILYTKDDIDYLCYENDITYQPYDPFWAYETIYNYIQENVKEVILIETKIKSDTLMLAGTVDSVLLMNNNNYTIVDFKFAKNPASRRNYRLQLAIYKYMLEEEGYQIDDTFNLFPNPENKKQPYTISRGKDDITREEVELVARLAHLRI